MNWWRTIETVLFGQPLRDEATGLQTTIDHAWPLSPGMMLAIWIVFGALAIGLYAVERPSAGRFGKGLLSLLRISLAGLILLMLLGWTVTRHRTDLPDVVLVVDDSESMLLADIEADEKWQAEIKRRLAELKLDEPTRLNLAKTLLLANREKLLTELAQRYHLKFYLAGASARSAADDQGSLGSAVNAVTASQPASRLGSSLQDVLELQRGRPTAAVIMFTDGVTTEGGSLAEAAEYARRKAVPLFFVGLGNDKPPRDLRLHDLLADDVVFVGDLVTLECKLTAEGFDGAANVRLKQKGVDAPLAQQTVTVPKGGGTQTIRLAHRPDKEGEFEYTIEVEPQAGEVNTQNNALTRTVKVTEEVIRVLLVTAGPSYEFRALKTMLERELNRGETSEEKSERGFRTVLQEADPAYVNTDKSAERIFPVSRDELFRYDVLILADMNPAFLSPSVMSNIQEFVTVRGGGVVFIAGPKYMPLAYQGTPLASLLPMELTSVQVPDPAMPITEPFHPRVTPLGLASPAMQLADTPAQNPKLWQETLAPLYWFIAAGDLRPGVRVLAEHPTKNGPEGQSLPLITLQFIGAGKVVFHATDETHRWRFRIGDAYFARYWIQTIRYLSRAKLLGTSRGAELTADRQQYRRGDTVRLRVRFLDDRLAPPQDDGVAVMLEREGGRRVHLTLRRDAANRGTFEGSAGNLADGKYRVWMATPTLEGQPPRAEFVISSPPGELARLQMNAAEMRAAAQTSGGEFFTYAQADSLSASLPKGRQVRIESLPPQPLWNAPILAAAFVVLLTGEWLLRKRWGLV
ncbi:MAG TPA: VWA domain-containing protein [Pirellulaceae bacterium]|nr:VWA domain-containing protein [Pirellulaceae bacterium]